MRGEPISRLLFVSEETGNHLSRLRVAAKLKHPTREFKRREPRLSAYSGLLQAGFTLTPERFRRSGGLLPHLFTLT